MPERPSPTLIDDRPMATAQVGAIGLCIIINMMDGFEIFVPSFIAPQLGRQWHLAPTQLGTLLSAGLAGMIAGALALAPLADWWGRRRSALLCLVIITFGMVLSAAAEGLARLIDYGVSTKVGISGASFMNLGGVAGDLVFAALTIRWSAHRLGPIDVQRERD